MLAPFATSTSTTHWYQISLVHDNRTIDHVWYSSVGYILIPSSVSEYHTCNHLDMVPRSHNLRLSLLFHNHFVSIINAATARTAIIAITIISSTKVNPCFFKRFRGKGPKCVLEFSIISII